MPRKPRSSKRRVGPVTDAELLAGASKNTALTFDERVRLNQLRQAQRERRRKAES